jgi:hypothetical protein
MEREILKYDLDYTLDDGSEGFIHIEVEKITHEQRNMMWDIIKEQYKVQELVHRIESIKSEVAIVLQRPNEISAMDISQKEKDVLLNESIKDLNDYSNQIKKITATIETYNDGKFYRKRFDVIKTILTRNRITDERILSFEFWEKNTDERAIIDLLDLFYYKDIKKNSPVNSETSNAMN